MDFDFKITTWERVNVPQEKEQEILEAIKAGEITSSNDIFYYLEGKIEEPPLIETLDETFEQMYLSENDGQATIDILEDGESIWNNTQIKP